VHELVIRGGTLVTPWGMFEKDLSISEGRIAGIDHELPAGREEIDATGLHVFPAVIDVHLHFNEPGRTEWEGAASGSRALAAGGGAVFFDMPLNSTPCTVNAREFDRKKAALEVSSIADFGLWGGLVPGNVPEMDELASRGAVGFKAFLCDSGLPEFPRADDLTLLEGLTRAADLRLPVAVHAESHEITQGLSRRMADGGRTGVSDFLASRPVIAEVEAIERATLLAREAGARLHIVHISSGRGVVAAAAAKARGVDVSIETCPHYLFFTEEDLERLGAIAKCAPPLRSGTEREGLWRSLLDGTIEIVASDHSPAPMGLKTGPFMQAWGGIGGVQSTLPVLLEAGHFGHGLSLERIADLVAKKPAERFRIAHKGSIRAGNDADLVLVDLKRSHSLRAEDLFQRHAISPYVGNTFRGIVQRTLRRGETIFMNGEICALTRGRMVRPSREN
jgi:allantoinase